MTECDVKRVAVIQTTPPHNANKTKYKFNPTCTSMTRQEIFEENLDTVRTVLNQRSV